jgi:hypothetical protein
MQIKYTIFDGEIGDGWEDIAAAIEALAKLTAAKLCEAYPSADVRVTVAHNTTGFGPEVVVVTDDGQGEDSIRINAGMIIEQAWSEFCDYPEAEYHTSNCAETTE